MEKDIGKIRKNENTDIAIRIDDFGGRIGLTIREFTSSDRYTGFTKSGTRIPAESFSEFKELINSIDESELRSMHESAKKSQPQRSFNENNFQKKIINQKSKNLEKSSLSEENFEEKEEIEEEVF
ncbi:MAG: hypothetical protein AABW90_01280 [Nanoarchaeota archaeon]